MKTDGMNPVYCPKGSGNLVLIVQTQQLGMTILTPAPSHPCCHTINWQYEVCRLTFNKSSSSGKAKTSILYILAMAWTASSRINKRKL